MPGHEKSRHVVSASNPWADGSSLQKESTGFTTFRQPHSSLFTVGAEVGAEQENVGPTLGDCPIWPVRADVSPEPRSSLEMQSRCNPTAERSILKVLGDIAHASRPVPIELATKKANRGWP